MVEEISHEDREALVEEDLDKYKNALWWTIPPQTRRFWARIRTFRADASLAYFGPRLLRLKVRHLRPEDFALSWG